MLGVIPVLPPEHTPQSSRTASPSKSPLQSSPHSSSGPFTQKPHPSKYPGPSQTWLQS